MMAGRPKNRVFDIIRGLFLFFWKKCCNFIFCGYTPRFSALSHGVECDFLGLTAIAAWSAQASGSASSARLAGSATYFETSVSR